ncbi:YheC/YheD family protein, partial [Priestia megaterium]|uniref:YheC/YheD family protein n=2 Tax=Priestia megaterium TaxID=1404 RepID=UPI00300995D3
MDQYKQNVPFVGICVSLVKPLFEKLARERLEKYPGNVILITFHIEDLNLSKRNVKGICWEKIGEEIKRKEGVYPLPDVVYLQCYVENNVIKQIERVIGRKVFNSFIFDKWECWSLLAGNNELRNHLPYTRKLVNKTNIYPFLYQYKDIFLKPINVSHAHNSRGIFRVKLKNKGNIEIFYREKNKMKEKRFKSYQKFQDWTLPRLAPGGYILQQGIETVKSSKNATDIRINMNKNSKGQWEVSMILVRVASNISHVIPKFVTAYSISNFIKTLTVDKEKEAEIEKSVINVGMKICSMLDKSGYHMGDLGIDLGMDENGHVWIFEINPLPFPFRGSIQDHSLIRPIEYASYLALTKHPQQAS